VHGLLLYVLGKVYGDACDLQLEVEAVDEGTVTKLLVEEGAQGVRVNAVIAELDGEGGGAAPKPAAAKVEAKPDPGPPASRSAAAQAATAPAVAKDAGQEPGGPRLRASPLAKRLAKIEGVDLLALKGSGPHGRIIKSDVLKAPKGGAKQAPTTGGGIASLIEPALLDDRIYAPDTYELIPLDGVRKVTARRLTQSFMQVPHFPLTIGLEIDHLLSARVRINEAAAASGTKVSVNDMLIKAWDWERGWSCAQVFEGHSHYVMAVCFNPKDANTFASASLDR
jgi:pyruvate dehydrogenase E2 component (dihydrolipoamide acetyltransferase)